ncbi:MAG: S1 family peptidase [Proteobacteria bacterium]|nr:S1 family peptidase [Pseudomonadota bacterium]
MCRNLFAFIFLAFVFVPLLMNMGCESSIDSDTSKNNRIIGRGIIGGEPTNGATEWKGVVALRMGFGLCSGTLIDPEVVLTAGHCVKLYDAVSGANYDYTKNPGSVGIVASANAYMGTQIAKGQEIVAHPSWEGEIDEGRIDLALIKLNKQITDIAPFGLRDFPMPEVRSSAFLVGYGQGGPGQQAGIQRMGETTLTKVNFDLLEISGESNICSGDSGGPVFTEQDGEWRTAGVNSFGITDTCSKDLGTYATNILSSCHWLNTTMLRLVGHDLGLTNCTTCEVSPVDTWGQGCGPGVGECPTDTKCMKPEGYSIGGGGFCGAPCCTLGEQDILYCGNITSGDEHCGIMDDNGQARCMINCEDDSDCVPGTECKNRPFEKEKICIAVGIGDTDGDTDTNIDTDTDVDTDTEKDPDASADNDTETDSDTDDSNNPDGNNDPEENGDSNCGCRQVSRTFGILSLVL